MHERGFVESLSSGRSAGTRRTGRLDAGAARSEVVPAFSESAEHIALTAKGIGGETPVEFGVLFA